MPRIITGQQPADIGLSVAAFSVISVRRETLFGARITNKPIMDKTNAINWFEINTADFARAKAFYEAILQAPLTEVSCGPTPMAIFPYTQEKGVGGALVHMPECGAPGAGGTLVYLNVEGDLDGVISRVAGAGGEIVKPRFGIGEHGFIAIIRDTEGNVVGLHSLK
jgi:predicted enzyme related to lactoylglutathione lyase